MDNLGARALKRSALAVALILAIAAAAGLVRLLPWLLAPEVPVRVALPFARALAAAATETAFVFGIPLGFAFAAAEFVDRGEARALFALGVSPLGMVRFVLPHALAAAIVSLVLGISWGSAADVPGRFARQLVEQGRASCSHVRSARSASVPLVGVSWLCFPGAVPRIAGPLPGAGNDAWFTATNLVPNDDLTSIELSDLRIVARMGEDSRRVDVSVSHGTVRGLPSWGRSAKLGPLERASLLAAESLVLCLLVLWVVILRGVVRQWEALLHGGVPALAAFVVLHRLDASSFGTAAYALVPICAIVALGLTTLLTARVARTSAR